MVTREELKGQWNQVKGRLLEHWGQLTDEDLRQVEGGTDRLVGTIQEKTGATRREVENFIERVTEEASSLSNLGREYAGQAMDAVREGYESAGRQTHELSDRLGHTISRRPLESILIAAAIGLFAGIIFSASRPKH